MRPMNAARLALTVFVLATLSPTALPAQDDAPLISRQVLFGNPDRITVRLSPDGEWLSYLAPRDGLLNVWVAPADDPSQARAVTHDTTRGVRRYFWAYTNQHILYLQDRGGDENWRLYSVDVNSLEEKDLTPVDSVRAEIQQVSPNYPDELLVALNDRDPALHDIHRVDLATGERELVIENPGQLGGGSATGFTTDRQFRVRFAHVMTPDGGQKLMQPGADDTWEDFETIPQEDVLTTGVRTFDATGETVYLVDSRGRNTAALFSHHLATGEKKLLAEDPKSDATELLVHPTQRTVQAVAFSYERRHWQVLDESIRDDLNALAAVDDGDLYVISRTHADDTWIVGYERDDGPFRYYRYERATKEATFLFTNRADLEGQPLTPMHPRIIESRDGLPLVSYLSLPVWADADGDGRPEAPVPMVLLVHGGPWARDSWGYFSLPQWLANRGYAVLSVNFRASTGFGKEFTNAGDLQWGRKMHDDLIDGVDWAVTEGITTKDQVAIMGGSYGGYATLAGLTMTPETFACGVDIVGPSNLITLMETIPPYWKPMWTFFTSRVGDPGTDVGRAMLIERSPLTHADHIVRPLLIGQGANDPRVKQAESDQIVQAMQAKGIPVTYVLFPDEGHGFARPENRFAFYAVAEAFLAEHLGGRYEPVGDAFEGSSIEIGEGAELVPGVAAALE